MTKFKNMNAGDIINVDGVDRKVLSVVDNGISAGTPVVSITVNPTAFMASVGITGDVLTVPADMNVKALNKPFPAIKNGKWVGSF